MAKISHRDCSPQDKWRRSSFSSGAPGRVVWTDKLLPTFQLFRKDTRRKKKAAKLQLWGRFVTCLGKDGLEGGVERSSPVKLAVIYLDILSVLINTELLFLFLVLNHFIRRGNQKLLPTFVQTFAPRPVLQSHQRREGGGLETIRFHLLHHLRPRSTSLSEKINNNKALMWFQWWDRCGLFSLSGFFKTSEVQCLRLSASHLEAAVGIK